MEESPELKTTKHHIYSAPKPAKNSSIDFLHCFFFAYLFTVDGHYFEKWFLVDFNGEFFQWLLQLAIHFSRLGVGHLQRIVGVIEGPSGEVSSSIACRIEQISRKTKTEN